MDRTLSAVAVAGLLVFVGSPRDARAGATVDLLFVAKNGGAIAPTASLVFTNFRTTDTFTMAVRMRNDEPLTVAIFSLNYDLDNRNELDVVGVFQWGGVPINKTATDFFSPLGGLSPTTATFAGSFQGVTTNFGGLGRPPRALPPAAGAFAGGYQMGTVVWKMIRPRADGLDIISGLLNPGIDFMADPAFDDISNRVLFNPAAVAFLAIPEPGTAALLSLGLLGLVLVRRRA